MFLFYFFVTFWKVIRTRIILKIKIPTLSIQSLQTKNKYVYILCVCEHVFIHNKNTSYSTKLNHLILCLHTHLLTYINTYTYLNTYIHVRILYKIKSNKKTCCNTYWKKHAVFTSTMIMLCIWRFLRKRKIWRKKKDKITT